MNVSKTVRYCFLLAYSRAHYFNYTFIFISLIVTAPYMYLYYRIKPFLLFSLYKTIKGRVLWTGITFLIRAIVIKISVNYYRCQAFMRVFMRVLRKLMSIKNTIIL